MKELVLDIGGSNFRSFLYEDDILKDKILLQTSDVDFLAELDKEIKQFNPEIISISFAGQVHNGVILSSPNISIKSMNLREYAKDKYNIELYIDNDLNCIALAEAKHIKKDNILVVYPGTGLGAAFVYKSDILRGAKNQALELGHIPYKSSDLLCGCGKNNCVELYASGSGMKKKLIALGYDINPNLKELSKSKDISLLNIYEDFVDSLAFALGSAITILNPSCVVLGGGVYMPNKDLIRDELLRKLKIYTFKTSLDMVDILDSKLEDSGIEGAMELKYI